MATSRERIHSIAGQSRFTPEGAAELGTITTPTETDERGVLKELDSHQIEKMSRQAVLDYQQRRSEQIEAKRAEKIEADDFERYKEAFVDGGGREKDAKAAWEAQKRLDASNAAQHASSEILALTKRRVRHGL